jgi:hypothetical protein
MSIISYRPRVTRIDPSLIARVRPLLSTMSLPADVPMETAGLAAACQTASVEAGFPRVELLSLPGGLWQIQASDTLGRGLVSEIQTGSDGGLTLITEVAGVKDGSCQTVMEKFDAALADQGVISQPPRRKFTGGVAELAAAKAFLQRSAPRFAADRAGQQAGRARRLNPSTQTTNSGRR